MQIWKMTKEELNVLIWNNVSDILLSEHKLHKKCIMPSFYAKKGVIYRFLLCTQTKYFYNTEEIYVVVSEKEDGSGKKGNLLFTIYPLMFLSYFFDCT